MNAVWWTGLFFFLVSNKFRELCEKKGRPAENAPFVFSPDDAKIRGEFDYKQSALFF